LGLLNKRRAALTTCPTEISFMHLKSIGQTLRKHGLHGAVERIMICLSDPGNPGAVSSGDVLAKIATTLVPTAAAI